MIVMSKMKINELFQIGSHVLAYSNSCVNPILYAYFSTPFRNAFIKLFGRKQNNNNTRWAFSGCQWTKAVFWVTLIKFCTNSHLEKETVPTVGETSVITAKIASNLFSQ